jgi:hypothetical protein
MENPLSGGELALGLFTGALGFGLADFTDRFLATHALTAGSAAGSFTDTPPTTGGAMGYQGLYNGTCVVAPMNITRWAAGLGIGVTPVIIAAFVSAPAGRSALQMFGMGALLRTLGKGLTDLVSSLTNQTAVGQQLYDNEIRAQMKQVQASGGTWSGPTPPYSGLDVAVPAAGSTNTTPTLGRAKACGCGKAYTGAGSCCGGCASRAQQTTTTTQQQAGAPPPPPPPPPPPSTGVAPPVVNQGTPAPTPPPTGQAPPQLPAPSPPALTQLAPQPVRTKSRIPPYVPPSTGTDNGLQGVPRRSRFDWGHHEDTNTNE